MIPLNKRDLFLILLFFLITFFTRIYIVENYQSHWDGPQYSIALFRYSLDQQTPAAPGYPIYLGIGWFLKIFLNNPHFALLLESVLFNALGVVVLYVFGRLLGGKIAAFILASIYISSPVIYFFGLTAYAYGVEVFFYALFALSVFVVISGMTRKGLYLGLTYALLLGFRPQDLIYTWPLFFFGLYYLSSRQKIYSALFFVIGTLLWVLPFMVVVGGPQEYFSTVFGARGSGLPSFSLIYVYQMREVLFKGLILTLGISCVFPVLYVLWVRQQLIKKASTKVSLFFALWILPPLSFNLFFRTDHAGYQLSYLIPLMILSSLAIKNLFKSKKIVLVLVLIVVLCNLFLFFRNRDPENTREYIPTSFHYSEIRKNDIKLGTKIEFIKTFDPNSSAIIVGEPDYIRPIMYYLPEFRIVQIDVLATKDPNFKDILREAKNFSMNTWKNNTNTYSFAKPVDTLICFDDECDKWVKGEKKIFLFPANSRIAVSKGPFLKIHYKLNSLSYSSL